MEDFQSAFLERIRDVAALDTAGRRTAAMHFGGVAIECLLKYIICTSLPKNAIGEWEWKTDSNDPGHTIHNPGHSYNAALRCHNRLRFRVQQLRYVLGWLDDVENPDGHYID